MGGQYLLHRHPRQRYRDRIVREDKEDNRHRHRQQQQERLSGDDEERRRGGHKPGERPEISRNDQLRDIQDSGEEHKGNNVRVGPCCHCEEHSDDNFCRTAKN